MKISGTAVKDKNTRLAAATVSPRRGTRRNYHAERTANILRIGTAIHVQMEPFAVRSLKEVGEKFGVSKQMAYFYVCCALGKLALRMREHCN